MAVRVRQQEAFQQPPLTEQPPYQPPVQKPKKSNKLMQFTFREKMLFVAFVLVVAALSVALLNIQGEIQTTTIEIQQLEKQATDMTKQNTDLKVQVSELSRYDRIWERAEALGLSLNEKNVKVVPGE